MRIAQKATRLRPSPAYGRSVAPILIPETGVSLFDKIHIIMKIIIKIVVIFSYLLYDNLDDRAICE